MAGVMIKSVSENQFVMPRRAFLKGMAAGADALASSSGVVTSGVLAGNSVTPKPAYRGPNVIIVRFGGGVRPAAPS